MEKGVKETLADRPDSGFFKGLMVRSGLRRRIRVWGLTFEAPRKLVGNFNRWAIRTGNYELPEARVAGALLDPALPLLEIGGGLGVIACHLNRLLQEPEHHVVVEFNRPVLPLLEKNRRRNGAKFRVLDGAVAYPQEATASGAVTPASPPGWTSGGRWSQASTSGSTWTLARILNDARWTKVNLVMDIEGMELEVLAKEASILRDRVATLCVETHPQLVGPKACAEFLEGVRALGFDLVAHDGKVLGFRKRRRGPFAQRR